MGKVIVLDDTSKEPLSIIGKSAGICWESDITSDYKNIKRAIGCINSGHGRVEEFPIIHLVLDGYSAKVIREWYTHVGGLPTRLQSSTRYVDASGFKYVIPHTIKRNSKALRVYNKTMAAINKGYAKLLKLDIPKEDASFLLPFGMETKIVDQRNMRNFIDMCHQRLCARALWEYRELMHDVKTALSEYSPQWKIIADALFVPKCELVGYCVEEKSCGRLPVNRDRAVGIHLSNAAIKERLGL